MNFNWFRRILPPSQLIIQHTRNCTTAKHAWVPKKKFRPRVYKSLEERIYEDDYTKNNTELYKPVNIGFPVKSSIAHKTKKKRGVKLENLHLEKDARLRNLLINLDAVEDDWIKSNLGADHVFKLASHYGIFNDLFGPFAYFYPTTVLNVAYEFDKETVSPVYFGNIIKPKEANNSPHVYYESDAADLWSLILVSPDNNLVESNTDCLHWFVGNIQGNDVSSGETVMNYMRPYPPKGTGYHRYVFLLFKQTHKVDFASFKQKAPCLELEKRHFSMYSFYKENEEVFTPAGISWYQSDWDPSTSEFFHQTLNMKEPIYEYQFPERYLAPQLWYPVNRSFNNYLDLHRDSKEIAKEVLVERLKNVNPFEEENVPEFPGAIPMPDRNKKIVWEREEFAKKNIGQGKYRDMYRGRLRPELLPDNPV